ncbi:MAG: glycosyltransferase family 2 protein [Flavobacteriales bacterium]
MRFSILIPVYNVDVRCLLKEIYEQSNAMSSDFEILIFDDASSSEFQLSASELEPFPEVDYRLLETNLGRSKIRNLLISEAKFEHCLIMDCDMMPTRTDDVKRYFEALQHADVVVGGHVYQCNPPEDSAFYLHWLYGSKYEVQSLKKRQQDAFSSFKTSVFGFRKTKFETLNFDETISTYGHEDTCFGWEMESNKLNIKHIDCPFLHLGLESTSSFLEKQNSAIENLYALYQNPKYRTKLEANSRLIRWTKSPVIRCFAVLLNPYSKYRLKKNKPSLWALQVFKLNRWISLTKSLATKT